MLVELSSQSEAMSRQIRKGFVNISKLLRLWLDEAVDQDLLKPGLNHTEIANFLVITLNGAAAIYTSSRDAAVIDQTVEQLHFYIQQLKIKSRNDFIL